MAVPYLSDDNKRVLCCGVPVVIDVSPYASNKIIVTYDGGEFEAPKDCIVYGGFDTINNEIVDVPHTSIVMNGGKVSALNGSNWGPGTIESTTIIFNDGEATTVSAGIGEGANDVVTLWDVSNPLGDCHIKKANIDINGGKIDSVYGGLGGGWGLVDNVLLTVRGGKIRLIAGTSGIFVKGTNPIGGTKKATVNVKGGDIEYLYGSSESSIGDVTMNVTGGEIGLCSMYGFSLNKDTPINTTIDTNLMGGKVDKLCVYANEQISSKHASMMENIEISYAPGVINEADIARSPKEIKLDPYKGQGAEMKTVRFYPFPHKSDRVYGILEGGLPLDRPSELPMSEQEIRMCLGMGHLFEVIKDKLVLLDEANYNKDNRDAREYAGELPCEDCELAYPRAKEETVSYANVAVAMEMEEDEVLEEVPEEEPVVEAEAPVEEEKVEESKAE